MVGWYIAYRYLYFKVSVLRPLKNGNLCSSSSRRSRTLSLSKRSVDPAHRGRRHFSEASALIGHKVPFRSLRLSVKVSLYHDTQMYHDQSDTKVIFGFYHIANRPQLYSDNNKPALSPFPFN